MGMHLAVSNSATQVAWAAYDAAMLTLQGMYLHPARAGDTAALRAERVRKAEEVAYLWSEWRDLFLAEASPVEGRRL